MYKCASFFAGVGGIDIGFEQANFSIVYANEFDKDACTTYNKNSNIVIEIISNMFLPPFLLIFQ